MARFGFDLDGVLYGYPVAFVAIVNSLVSAGHECFITSGHARREWDESDKAQLASLGYEVDGLCPDLMMAERTPHVSDKGAMANNLDMVFDDDAARIQAHTKTPILHVPTKDGRYTR